jgi:hypothetical protein
LAKISVSGKEQDLQSIPAPKDAAAQSLKDRQQITQLPAKSETSAQVPKTLTAELDRLHFQSNTVAVKSSESDGDRALRRQQAEEMASSLRDDKLLSLTGLQVHRNHSFQGEGPSHALTQENLEKQLAHDAEPTAHPRRSSSSDAVPRTRSEGGGDSLSARPSLGNGRFRDSERTVTTSSTIRQDGSQVS